MGGVGSGRRFQNRRGPNLEEEPQLDVIHPTSPMFLRTYWVVTFLE